MLLLHEMVFWLISAGRVILSDVVGAMLPDGSGQLANMGTFCKQHGSSMLNTIGEQSTFGGKSTFR